MARILVADDTAFIRAWCRASLTRRGHEVVEAAYVRVAAALEARP